MILTGCRRSHVGSPQRMLFGMGAGCVVAKSAEFDFVAKRVQNVIWLQRVQYVAYCKEWKCGFLVARNAEFGRFGRAECDLVAVLQNVGWLGRVQNMILLNWVHTVSSLGKVQNASLLAIGAGCECDGARQVSRATLSGPKVAGGLPGCILALRQICVRVGSAACTFCVGLTLDVQGWSGLLAGWSQR